MMTNSNTNISLMIMYKDESVDVRYVDDSRLHLSPCGSEFMLEKAPARSAHPLQSSEKVRQRTRFATSSYKDLMLGALEFRNEYATRPYLPEELIPDDHRKQVFSIDPEVEWPACYSCTAEVGLNREIVVSSVERSASLLLSSSGEEFSVNFTCRLSHNQHHRPRSRDPNRSVTEHTQQDNQTCRPKAPSQQSSTCAEQQQGAVYLSTRVVQHHSVSCVPLVWRYPLSLALHLWHAQSQPPSGERNRGETEEETARGRDQTERAVTMTNTSIGERRSHLPQALPLGCPSPHQHRWKSRYSLVQDEQEADQDLPTELVKVVWCQGVLYRIVDGAIPVVEVSPGDGSVIRSNGVLASYFTHHRAGPGPGEVKDVTYHLSSLPPDTPGQVYSVCSMVTRASRILKYYNQARHSLKLPATQSCLNQARHSLKLPATQSCLNQARHSLKLPATQSCLNQARHSLKLPATQSCLDQARHSLKLPATQSCLDQETSSEPFVEEVHISESGYMNITETRQSRPNCVAEELEKIKRFNFLLENSHLLKAQRGSTVVGCGSKEHVAHCEPVSESIAEALQRTSKTIQDIDNLLSATEERSDVRALMARFNTGGGRPMEGGVHPKLASHSSLSTSSPLLAKLAALEKSRSGGALTTTKSPATKPVFPKKFETAAREDVGTLFPKPQSFKPRPVETIRDTESSGPESSITIPPLKRPPVNTAFPDNKVKPAPASGSAKPPWVKDSESGNTPTVPKLPLVLKPNISISSLQSNLDQETPKENPTPSTPKLRPISMLKFFPPHTQQNSLSRQESEASLQTLNSSKCMPPQPPLTLKPNFLTAQAGARDELVPHEENDDPSAPKKKPLPNVFSLGDPPLKPNRPPHVTLQMFRTEGPELSTAGPSPLAPHTSSFPAPLTPCLLSNSPAAIIQADQEESYDDIGVMNLPSPLPPGGHPNLKIEAELSDEEMYEDLEERWTEQEAKGLKETNEVKGQEKKNDKEEKKRLEQEKKMQKAREKKEQEAKKKYKLSGPIQVIHKAKAQVECKGGKTDLPLTQGEIIDIIRITDNPEGRWLARNNEGNYGYVRTESVGIDYDLIKEQNKGPLPNQSERNPEVYDDVGILDNACSGVKVQQAEDGDIYDDVDGSNQNRFPPPLPTVFKEGDEIYDDVESQSFTASPPLNSLPQLTPKGKQGVMDPKKKKKFEKEEKEFRKKFKFEGEIQVLYDVTIDPSLDSKKWGNKDLQLKPGEVIDVIVKPTYGKLIGRNRDGKFGYVSMVNVAQDGGDVYDDIGESCIYDND